MKKPLLIAVALLWALVSDGVSAPLTNGPKTISVDAIDVAGNKSSSGITVTLGQPLEPQSPPVVFGPRIFTQPDEVVSFSVTSPTGIVSLQVFNGEAVEIPGEEPGVVEMRNLVTSGAVFLNGQLVGSASDFDHNTTREFWFQMDVTLSSVNTLEVKLQGPAGSFVTVQIIEPEPILQFSSENPNINALNWGDSIDLWWEPDESAAEYVVFRSNSAQGPWQELFRRPQTRPQGVDFTADATLMDLCYKLEARDAAGLVIRLYEPICVPKFAEKRG